jgi:hypothetical protein
LAVVLVVLVAVEHGQLISTEEVETLLPLLHHQIQMPIKVKMAVKELQQPLMALVVVEERPKLGLTDQLRQEGTGGTELHLLFQVLLCPMLAVAVVLCGEVTQQMAQAAQEVAALAALEQ